MLSALGYSPLIASIVSSLIKSLLITFCTTKGYKDRASFYTDIYYCSNYHMARNILSYDFMQGLF